MTDRGDKTRQMTADLRERLAAGEWAPGERLPSEDKLTEQFGFSRTTVRRAIDNLKVEGLLVSRQGSGVFVRDADPTLRLVLGWHPEQAEYDAGRLAEPPITFSVGKEKGKVRLDADFREMQAPERVAGLLGVSQRDRVVARGYKLLVGKRPILTSTSYLPIELVRDTPVLNPNTEDIQVGQLALLGQAVTQIGLEIRARPPIPDEAAQLDVDKGTSMLAVTRKMMVGADPDQVVTAMVEIVARADRVYLQIIGPEPPEA